MSHRKRQQNKGQILEDLVYKDLRERLYNGKRFYHSVMENLVFKDASGCRREMDDVAVHHAIHGSREYAVIIECKLGDRRTKAVKQLWYMREHMRRNYPNIRVFYMYAHNYNAKNKSFIIEWISNKELDRR